jgi:hypothetical protein
MASFLAKNWNVVSRFLRIFTQMLNQLETYGAQLVPLVTRKEIGCSTTRCNESIIITSPDDENTYFTLAKPEGDSIEKEYECKQKHVTKGYWSSPNYTPNVSVG